MKHLRAGLRELRAWRPSDPGRFALRGAVRAAVVLPVALALGRWMGDGQTALFAAFGTLALLVFVDFGGPRPVRLLAYLALAAVGSVLIAIGTLCSQEPAAAAIAMGVLGFLILFSGIVNGYFAAAASATLLSFIVPVMVTSWGGLSVCRTVICAWTPGGEG